MLKKRLHPLTKDLLEAREAAENREEMNRLSVSSTAEIRKALEAVGSAVRERV